MVIKNGIQEDVRTWGGGAQFVRCKTVGVVIKNITGWVTHILDQMVSRRGVEVVVNDHINQNH